MLITNIIVTIFFPIAKTFIQLFIGVLLYKYKYLNKETSKALATLTIDILYPMIYFTRIGVSLTMEKLNKVIVTLPMVVIYHAIGFLLGSTLVKSMNLPAQFKYIVIASMMFGNYMIMPTVTLQGLCSGYGYFAKNVRSLFRENLQSNKVLVENRRVAMTLSSMSSSLSCAPTSLSSPSRLGVSIKMLQREIKSLEKRRL
jgi:predicted permease